MFLIHRHMAVKERTDRVKLCTDESWTMDEKGALSVLSSAGVSEDISAEIIKDLNLNPNLVTFIRVNNNCTIMIKKYCL